MSQQCKLAISYSPPGMGPGTGEGPIYKSQLGTDATIEEGYASARQVAIGLLSTLKHALGDLDRVKRVVKVVGFVNSAPDFTDQPAVVNGASDFFVEVFGDKGKHARSAVRDGAIARRNPS